MKRKKVNNKKISPIGELLERYEGKKPPKSFWVGISRGLVGFVFGLAKSGKTIVCENLALSIASGRERFLGKPIELPKKKVLYISMEENVGIRIIQRGNKQVKEFSSEEKKNIKENLFYSDEEFLRSVENTQDWNFVEVEIKKYKPRVVFLDSTNRFNIDIEKRDEANSMMQKIRGFAEKYRCAIILIHHTNKSQKDKPITEASMSGSSALTRDADFFIGVNSLSNGTRYIKFITNRYHQTPEKCIVFSIQNNYLIDYESEEYESELLKSLDGRYTSDNTEMVYEFIKVNLDENGRIETNTLHSHFVDGGLISKKTLFNKLRLLIKAKMIEKVGKGVYKLIRNNDTNSESADSVDD